MNNYEQKKQARFERMEKRIDRLEAFAKGKDLSMFGEDRSGIPTGQPILVGHHSEKRHRKHLERINRIVQAGYEASEKADKLKVRLENMLSTNIIQVDNPDAKQLIEAKISLLEKENEKAKRINKLIGKHKDIDEGLAYFKTLQDDDSKYIVDHLTKTYHFYYSKNIKLWYLSTTSSSAEVRRLKSRLVELEKLNKGFESFEINDIKVELNDGQIQVDFPSKPNEEIRSKLKRSPLALKWSSYSKKWVRKYTSSIDSRFISELKKVLDSCEKT